MHKVALAVIAGPNAIEDGIERMLKSVEGKVDGVYIADTTSEDGMGPVFDQIFDMLDPSTFQWGLISPVGWHENFAEARNASFAIIDKAIKEYDHPKYDYIIWLDCDDVLPENFDLQAACDLLEAQKAHGGLIDYHYLIDEETGEVLTSHLKERLFRADWKWQWIYPIHENCVGPMGTKMVKLNEQLWYVEHHRGVIESKQSRNKKIISDWYRAEGRTEPRATMFMAHQTLAMVETAETDIEKRKLLGMAFKLYQQFMTSDPEPGDAYTVNGLCSEIMRLLGRFEDSINLDLQGIKMRPQLRSSYLSIAQTHYAAGSYDEAIEWALMARNIEEEGERGTHIYDHREARYKPHMVIGSAYLKKEMPEKAHEFFSTADLTHNDQYAKERMEECNALAKEIRQRGPQPDQKILHRAMWGDPSNPNDHLEVLPSVCFFVPPSIEDWNPYKLRTEGLGGTETCVIRLAENLGRRGHRVAIFGNPGSWTGRQTENVEWYDHSEWSPDEPFDVFVGLRAPQIFDTPVNAKLKVLWLHDLTMGDSRYGDYGDRFSMTDVIVCPSTFHMEHIIKVYGNGKDSPTADARVILNGFDPHRFERNPVLAPERSRNRVVYASSPDRGLTRLLELWPQIEDRHQKAELHIYYGWDSIDAIINSGAPTGPQLAYFKQQTIETIDKLTDAGYFVEWHGRVDQDKLAREFWKSSIMAYPANFQETFGLVFAQALMAGVKPIVSELGMVGQFTDFVTVVPGPPDSMEFGPRFVDAVVKKLKSPPHEDARANYKKYVEHMSWFNITSAWQEMIQEKLNAAS